MLYSLKRLNSGTLFYKASSTSIGLIATEKKYVIKKYIFDTRELKPIIK